MRTSGVRLEAETAGYKREMTEAAKVTEDVETAADKLARTGPRVKRSFKDMGDGAESAGHDVDGLKRDLGQLDSQITKTTAELKVLGREFARTGDVDIGKAFRKKQSELRQQINVKKLFSDEGEESAVGFAARFSQRLGPLVANLPISGPLGAAIGAGAVAAAPVLIPALSAAVSAGVGGGAVGIGLALAAKDPIVAARAQAIGAAFAAGVQQKASQAFQGPLLVSLNKFEALGIRTSTRIGHAFDAVAPHVVPMVDKLVDAADEIGGALEKAARDSGPALDALGDSVTLLSHGITNVIDTLSEGGPEAASNLRLIAGATADIATQTANFLGVINKLSDNAWLTGPLIPLLRKHYDDASKSGKDMAQSTTAAAAATHTFIMDTFKADPPVKALAISLNNAEKAALGERQALRGLSNELRSQADPVFALRQAQVDLKVAQDKAAEATRNHGRKSVEARAATRELAMAAIDLQGKAGALSSSFNGRLSPSMIATFKAAGLTKGQIKDVAREFFNAKREGDKYAKKYQASATLVGGPAVSTKLKILGEMQAALRLGNKPAAFYGTLNRALVGKYDKGGWTGPGPRLQPAGIVHADEYVVSKPARRRLEQARPGALDYMNTTGRWPGYAGGGYVWPYPVTAAKTRIPSKDEVISAVPVGRGYRWMEAAVHAAFPGMPVLSDFRPGARTRSGNVSYHALGRAVDFPPSRPLAEWINAKYMRQTKELITPWQSLNIKNGVRHAFSADVYNDHNFAGGNPHDHWAMDGLGGSVAGWSAGTSAGGGSMSMATYNVTVNAAAGAHPAEVGRAVVSAIKAYEKNNGTQWRTRQGVS